MKVAEQKKLVDRCVVLKNRIERLQEELEANKAKLKKIARQKNTEIIKGNRFVALVYTSRKYKPISLKVLCIAKIRISIILQ